MKILNVAAVVAVMGLPSAVAMAADDYHLPPSNAASAACKAERLQMGVSLFKDTYGTNINKSNALGKCISKHVKSERANQRSATAQCRAEQSDPNFAATHGGKTFEQFYGTGKGKNAFGKCATTKAKAESKADVKADVAAAKACKKERKSDAAAFRAEWGSKRNAFGKCVSATAKELHA